MLSCFDEFERLVTHGPISSISICLFLNVPKAKMKSGKGSAPNVLSLTETWRTTTDVEYLESERRGEEL
jgi:hypothetical protein